MFKQLEQFLDNSDLNIMISKKDNTITVSVLPKLKTDKEQALSPLLLRGTADDLDAGFINALSTKLPVANGLIVEAKQFEASVEAEGEKAEKAATKAKSKTVTSAPAAPKVKEKTDSEKAKDAIKAGDDAMTAKNYPLAVEQYQIASDILKTNKGVNDKLLASQRWLKSVTEMYGTKETIAASNPAQAELLNHPNVIVAKVALVIEEAIIVDDEPSFDDAEGPEEGHEDNAPDEEEETFNFD